MEKNSPTYTSIDEYIAAAPEEVQPKLRTLRATINEIVPEAQETIKYQMPTFVLNGKPQHNLVYFALFKKHISLYPSTPEMEPKIPGYATYQAGKGTFQFPLDEELPLDFVRQVVQFRKDEAMAKAAKGQKGGYGAKG